MFVPIQLLGTDLNLSQQFQTYGTELFAVSLTQFDVHAKIYHRYVDWK